jgi:hypothetical protein
MQDICSACEQMMDDAHFNEALGALEDMRQKRALLNYRSHSLDNLFVALQLHYFTLTTKATLDVRLDHAQYELNSDVSTRRGIGSLTDILSNNIIEAGITFGLQAFLQSFAELKTVRFLGAEQSRLFLRWFPYMWR